MNLHPVTQRTLARMAELQARIDELGVETPEEVFAGYRALQPSIVAKFLPLVKTLVKVGLFAVNLDHEALAETHGYIAASFGVAQAFDNGNIWPVNAAR